MFRGVQYDFGNEKYYVYYNSELKGVFKNDEEQGAVAHYNSFLQPSSPPMSNVTTLFRVFQAKEGINFKSSKKKSSRELNKIKKILKEHRIKVSKKKVGKVKKNKDQQQEDQQQEDQQQEDQEQQEEDENLFGEEDENLFGEDSDDNLFGDAIESKSKRKSNCRRTQRWKADEEEEEELINEEDDDDDVVEEKKEGKEKAENLAEYF